jgi:hypothetical protein
VTADGAGEQPARKAAGGSSGSGGPKGNLGQWGLKTAAAIIGGLGTAGAMAVIGSAVLWARFREAGLPAIQAVSVQPKQEALVQGAEVTISFLLVAVAAVVVMYITDSEEAEVENGKPHKIKRRTMGVLGGLLLAAIAYLTFGTDLGAGAVAILSAGAVVLAAGCFWIGHSDRRNFWAFAAAVFVATIVFAGAAGYAVVREEKFVQAVAILRDRDDAGLTGFYVAAAAKKIYFANSIGVDGIAPERKPMQEVALDDAVTYSVGPLESVADATLRAQAMLKRLIANREANPQTTKADRDNGPEPMTRTPAGATVANVAKAFLHSIVVSRRISTRSPLCLVRYTDAAKPVARGHWWTSCREAARLRRVTSVRERLALPGRFQASYDMRVRAAIPVGRRLVVLAGHAAPQCAHSPAPPCGHKYAGGGVQYYLPEPAAIKIESRRCTTAPEDRRSRWRVCGD